MLWPVESAVVDPPGPDSLDGSVGDVPALISSGIAVDSLDVVRVSAREVVRATDLDDVRVAVADVSSGMWAVRVDVVAVSEAGGAASSRGAPVAGGTAAA